MAGAVVIGLNFVLNNRVTFRFNRLRRRQQWIGLGIYSAACAVGLTLNVNLADLLHKGGLDEMAAGAAGIVVGSVWNYSATSLFVWRVGRAEQMRKGQGAQPGSDEMLLSLERLRQSLQGSVNGRNADRTRQQTDGSDGSLAVSIDHQQNSRYLDR